ncbi:glycosyltransferase [Gramella sp. BOM4]|nr:glycosyltransferase [Christiangramia bathymodioli]
MRLAVFTHAEHFVRGETLSSYAPYVREMDLWFEHVEDISVIAPGKTSFDRIDKAYSRVDIQFVAVKLLNFTSKRKTLISITRLPGTLFKIIKLMYKADHLHIRCPGNIGLLACFIQIFFPGKPKTVKYAGNWDNDPQQPWSYKLQKQILANEYLTKNAKVLVYGSWPGQSKNIISFFTSSFNKADIKDHIKDFSPPYRFLFVGSLVEGKRPITALGIIHSLKNKGFDVRLDMYGDGILKEKIKTYIRTHDLENVVTLHGNQEADIIKVVYTNAHFSILPSKSEGWPKALTEAMFFGCVPIGTAVSCVPWMLGHGERGILIEPEVDSATEKISRFLSTPFELENRSLKAQEWSQHYTMEKFSSEIKKFL